jgi:hypothetical protein
MVLPASSPRLDCCGVYPESIEGSHSSTAVVACANKQRRQVLYAFIAVQQTKNISLKGCHSVPIAIGSREESHRNLPLNEVFVILNAHVGVHMK